jgi:hypothetical protein
VKVKRELTQALPYEVYCAACGPRIIKRIDGEREAHTFARAHVRETGHSVSLDRTKTTLYWLDYELPPGDPNASTHELVIGNAGELRIQ